MEILITAGGTSEPIDNVRSITNHSSGGLGKKIAEAFLATGHQVTYVTTPQALRPKNASALTIIEIETTAELEKQLVTLFSEKQFDSIVHSMAVSDFTTETALTEDTFIETLAQELQTAADFSPAALSQLVKTSLDAIGGKPQAARKISSDTERLLIFLKKNPKIIAMIRDQQPNTILVGFKLLVHVSEAELIQVASNALVKNRCDFVLANDLDHVHATKHEGLLIGKTGLIEKAHTKGGIAALIVRQVESNWRK